VLGNCVSRRAGESKSVTRGPTGLQVLEATYEKKVLAGYNVYVHTPDDNEQTGKQAAIWGRDIQWLGDVKEVAEHAEQHRYILTLHWHWHFGTDSAWTGKRKTPVDVGNHIVENGRSDAGQVHRQRTADLVPVVRQGFDLHRHEGGVDLAQQLAGFDPFGIPDRGGCKLVDTALQDPAGGLLVLVIAQGLGGNRWPVQHAHSSFDENGYA
jgi:hypothetical protein